MMTKGDRNKTIPGVLYVTARILNHGLILVTIALKH
jgi:hypothetical protein